MMVEPTKEMEEVYEFLLSLENVLLDNLKPGRRVCDAYNAAVGHVKEKNNDWYQYITSTNFGLVLFYFFSD
jgi:nucleosome binding factor SPN SPT16 subunit